MMTSRDFANWSLSALGLILLLVFGRPLLVPLVFALLIWAVFNAFADTLVRFKLPRWLAWLGSLIFFLGALYVITRIVGGEAAQFAAEAPGYVATLQDFMSGLLAPLRLGINVEDLFSRSDFAGFLTGIATSLGFSLFALIQVLIYVGFLLAEQSDLTGKFARLQINADHRGEGQILLRLVASQIQSYLGVCTVLSAIMGSVSYVLLILLGVNFAAFWALIIFFLTYIPTVGVVAVVLPALMALVQFGTFAPALVIVVVLGGVHFVLLNVAATLILGQSLNLSPFVIILALTFWGLVWGLAGLFLAVPITAALAIVCAHIDGLRWVAVLVAAPPPRTAKTLKP
ncbi:MAG TPA: AI-2E family transporter [Micropepsaceae bacterium]|jgi:predicted PurR-regulated permease PerM|nr:AI-2E family transporter [Micropepsaceae bacterium]